MSDLTDDQQAAALTVLSYVSDLITNSHRKEFTREELLVIINLARNDPDIFSPEMVVWMDEIDRDLEMFEL